MSKWLEKLEQWAGGGPGGKKRVNTLRWLLLLGLCGVLIMLINSYLHIENLEPYEEQQRANLEIEQAAAERVATKSPFQDYEEQVELRLQEILEKIVGVGSVDVLVNIESSEEIIVYQNHRDTQQTTDEKDRNGAVRQITEISRTGEIVLYEVSGNERPIILKTIKPKIRGIIIVAGGAENSTVHNMILDTVRKGLDVPPHRISIIPRKQRKSD